MAEWTKHAFGKGAIDRAGTELIPWWTLARNSPENLGQLYTIVDNWRPSHAWLLNAFQITLGNRARRVESDALVAQRLKRFISVMNKLAREPIMKLSQMQDLGGCRAIMADVANVNRLFELYMGTSAGLFDSDGRMKCRDYIKSPKPDGYRGIHLIGRYSARCYGRGVERSPNRNSASLQTTARLFNNR
jgi:ppGpp synthetase/RelA/SpoT-type nucleotidyltranferase